MVSIYKLRFILKKYYWIYYQIKNNSPFKANNLNNYKDELDNYIKHCMSA